jgi:hypothetical protein
MNFMDHAPIEPATPVDSRDNRAGFYSPSAIVWSGNRCSGLSKASVSPPRVPDRAFEPPHHQTRPRSVGFFSAQARKNRACPDGGCQMR